MFKKLSSSLLIVSACVFSSCTPTVKQEIAILPTPVSLTEQSGSFVLKDGMKIGVSDQSLFPAVGYLQEILRNVISSSVEVTTDKNQVDMYFQLKDTGGKPGSYKLQSTPEYIRVEANDYSGIISAITTIRQLLPAAIEVQGEKQTYSIPVVQIEDAPRFEWRGFMLDASRHFWNKDEVKHVLDLMSLYKLNKFHWHLSDDQGWRIEIEKYPLLTEKGAWRKFNQMLGFSEEDVRTMLRYYQEAGQLQGDIEEMIQEMKPWYDNYCFAEESLDKDPKMFNCDMVLYYLRNRIQLNKSPKQMIDPNTRTDYNKMKKLIQLDRLDGNRKGVIKRIAEEGKIMTNLYQSFSADQITNPEIFPSLLFYYGMLTIIGTRGNLTILGIPNTNVRKQYYEYILEEYQNHHYINLIDIEILFNDMAFDGQWRPALEFIAKAYKENTSVRSSIEGERNIQGFFTAYLSVNAYYLTMPEVELNHGFCDMFLMPDLQRYAEVAHSYILELKYLPKEKYDTQGTAQWQEAVEQIHGYAAGPKVRQLCQGTQLHCIVIQFCGWELVRMEEV